MADTIPESLRQIVRARANGSCEYCRSQELFATERFSVEHIKPLAVGGSSIAENLALACQGCNGHKAIKITAVDPETQTQVPLFHPRQQHWHDHFAWSEGYSHIIGITPTGRATVTLLHLNRASLLRLRYALRAINAHPPKV